MSCQQRGYGGCGSVRQAIHFEERSDGCWMVKLTHDDADYLKMTVDGMRQARRGGRRTVWWIADSDDQPHDNFANDDFMIPLKVKEAAMELLDMIRIRKEDNPLVRRVAELEAEVKRLKEVKCGVSRRAVKPK